MSTNIVIPDNTISILSHMFNPDVFFSYGLVMNLR